MGETEIPYTCMCQYLYNISTVVFEVGISSGNGRVMWLRNSVHAINESGLLHGIFPLYESFFYTSLIMVRPTPPSN